MDTEDHAAAVSNVDLALANITHTITGNVITLKWTAIDGVDNMDIFVFDPKEESWIRLGEVKMSAEQYAYTMARDGEHIFNFKPLNGGKEFRYNVNATRSEEETPEIQPVQVGPAENIMLLLLLSGLAYIGYRRYTAKRA
jgi:hypothetical protein